jgi:hypothetical protein
MLVQARDDLGKDAAGDQQGWALLHGVDGVAWTTGSA